MINFWNLFTKLKGNSYKDSIVMYDVWKGSCEKENGVSL